MVLRVKWINNFFRDRTQRFVLESASSDKVPVPQGTVLGPCLFLFYINDIAVGLSSTVRLFADDTMLYLTVQNNKDAVLLQRDLHMLCQWEATWLMEFHPDKCEVISVTRKINPITYPYLLLVCVSFTIIGQPRNSVLIRRV